MREGDPSLLSVSEKLDTFLDFIKESKEERSQLLKAIWEVNTSLTKLQVRMDSYAIDTVNLKKITNDLQLKQAQMSVRLNDISKNDSFRRDMSTAAMTGLVGTISKWVLLAIIGGLFVWVFMLGGRL